MEEKTELSIVFCTTHTDEENQAFITHLKESCGCDALVYCVRNPEGVALTKVYADLIEENVIESDIVAFIHDDVEFLREGWGKELNRLFNDNPEYGIIGVAGSAYFDAIGAWWNYNEKYGQVLHRKDGKSWLTAFSPLLDKDLQEVVVIDGLFMGVHKKRITKMFDRDFEGFDHYDTSFCISNFIDGKCKIGVTTNIRMAHNSIGELKPSWKENLQLLNRKYKKYYPLKVK